MRIVFIGTNAAIPTSNYGTSGVYVQIDGKNLLFDCGEGTQQRMMRFNASINVDAVYLTHFDTDHVLGLPGLIRTLDMNNRQRSLDVFVSDSITDRTRQLIAGSHGWPSYRVNIKGFDEGRVSNYENFKIDCFSTDHDYASHGFVIDEGMLDGRLDDQKLKNKYNLKPSEKYGELKRGNSVETSDGTVIQPNDVKGDKRNGRKVVYTGDGCSNQSIVEASENADLLIHESTFHGKDSERATKTNHSTSKQAGETARKAGVEKLVLTHISARYEDRREILREDAIESFESEEVQIAKDGTEVKIPRS